MNDYGSVFSRITIIAYPAPQFSLKATLQVFDSAIRKLKKLALFDEETQKSAKVHKQKVYAEWFPHQYNYPQYIQIQQLPIFRQISSKFSQYLVNLPKYSLKNSYVLSITFFGSHLYT